MIGIRDERVGVPERVDLRFAISRSIGQGAVSERAGGWNTVSASRSARGESEPRRDLGLAPGSEAWAGGDSGLDPVAPVAACVPVRASAT